ncbi:conserved domain protein (plasmid) [Shigella boydii CDC 3083-94]|uniref:Conserved domain protein n=1 Tax=Shigella boydii serotype 18 (strain CDC 3083-94 / BS512) TaxID=344609 RepID=B2TSV1_SHIB3|nr:conserved domain protein [Shigella boydii CDC 3083-94]
MPRMKSLYDWIKLQRKTLSNHAEMVKAFNYILNHWNVLNEFCRVVLPIIRICAFQ